MMRKDGNKNYCFTAKPWFGGGTIQITVLAKSEDDAWLEAFDRMPKDCSIESVKCI